MKNTPPVTESGIERKIAPAFVNNPNNIIMHAEI